MLAPKPADIDAAGEAVRDAERPRIHTFIGASDIHIQHQMRKTREEVLEMAVAAVQHARKYVEDVEFSPMDASRADPDYLCRIVEAAIKAGATTINIPDTVGYATPEEFAGIITMLKNRVPGIEAITLSCHCHDDLGLAVANSLAAAEAGCDQIECAINGLGERAGNTPLEEVVMAIHTRGDRMGLRNEHRDARDPQDEPPRPGRDRLRDPAEQGDRRAATRSPTPPASTRTASSRSGPPTRS